MPANILAARLDLAELEEIEPDLQTGHSSELSVQTQHTSQSAMYSTGASASYLWLQNK